MPQVMVLTPLEPFPHLRNDLLIPCFVKCEAGFFLILIPGCFYLSTLAPSMGYQDIPEFVDTSFALGISHPADFPAYNLIAKAITFYRWFPMPSGSISFPLYWLA